MALLKLKGGMTADLTRHQARGRFVADSRADLPEKGDAVSWVTDHDGLDLGAGWYVADVSYTHDVQGYTDVVARRPGIDWTWLGLTPISSEGSYRIDSSAKLVSGTYKYGYWNYFDNWDDADAWAPGEAPTLIEPRRSWIVEWVDDTRRDYMLFHSNPSAGFPSGFDPPAGTGAGIYWCMRLEIEPEPWASWTGTVTTYYRHFAEFWEAPTIDNGRSPSPVLQLSWNAEEWTVP